MQRKDTNEPQKGWGDMLKSLAIFLKRIKITTKQNVNFSILNC